MKWIGICVLIALVGLAIVATPSMAAPGGNGNGNGQALGPSNGNGNGNGNSQELSATFTVEPNDTLAYSEVTISGEGFVPNEPVSIKLEVGWCCYWGSVTADENGSVSFTNPTEAPGTYRLWGYQDLGHGNGGKDTLMAYLEFEVVEP